jgi:hypothetical protein
MGSVIKGIITGWWSWLVALWALALFAIAVIALFGGDEGVVHGVVMALVLFGLAAVTATALVVRRKAPRLAAWLLVAGVGPMALPGGSASIWMLIPTAIALVIIVGGVITGEMSFRRPKQAGAALG